MNTVMRKKNSLSSLSVTNQMKICSLRKISRSASVKKASKKRSRAKNLKNLKARVAPSLTPNLTNEMKFPSAKFSA